MTTELLAGILVVVLGPILFYINKIVGDLKNEIREKEEKLSKNTDDKASILAAQLQALVQWKEDMTKADMDELRTRRLNDIKR